LEIRFRVPEWVLTVVMGLAYFIVLPLALVLITSQVVSGLALAPPLRGLWLLIVRWKTISELLLLGLCIATGVSAYRRFAVFDPSQPAVGFDTTRPRVPWGPRSRPKAWLSLVAFIVLALALISLIGPTAPEECSDPSGVNC
jgi:hypothetical protein